MYAASPLFNCNPDYANIKNKDGKQLFPQDKSQENQKWIDAEVAYRDFFEKYVDTGMFKLYTVMEGDKIDFYESIRQVTSGLYYDNSNKELIFIRLNDNNYHFYEITPTHKHVNNSDVKGGMAFGATQEMVDLFFTDKGLRIIDDPDYPEYTGIPSADLYEVTADYNNPQNPNTNYFLKRNEVQNKPNYVLKQWKNREARFYVNITFNGSTWVNVNNGIGKITTELTLNGNSGLAQSNHDCPVEGYGIRKMAPTGKWQSGRHCVNLLRLADMYLGYAEVLSALGQYDEAITKVNKIRARAGIAEYGNSAGKDNNGYNYIPYPSNRDDIDKRIRRERLIELAYEWNHFFDVRRWKVADMAVGDDWIYPSYHKGGEGGYIHGMDYGADVPEFFKKIPTNNRVFEKRHIYSLFQIKIFAVIRRWFRIMVGKY